MATNKLTQGNPANFVWALLDVDGTTLADLASATEINFTMRLADQLGTTPVADLTLTLSGEPAQVLIDNPVAGSLAVQAISTDMGMAAGLYDLFLQVVISAARTLEYQQLRAVQILEEAIA